MNPGDVRFAADAMLQSLAKWLRLLGYDCVAGGGLFGRELVEAAVAERRWVLTRNRRYAAELPQLLLTYADLFPIVSERLPGQLREVVEHFALETSAFRFTRCLVCNEPLHRVPLPQAAPGVPEEVLARENRFWQCSRCGRLFWQGSHVRRSVNQLNRWLSITP
jgi:uncharacterized protein with PIN domain